METHELNALDVAEYIVNVFNNNKESISNLKLQKLLFFTQMSFLRKNEYKISDDFLAWRYGPVVREVYNKYRKFGMFDIDCDQNEPQIPEGAKNYIDSIIQEYGPYSAYDLVEKTHESIAWNEARSNEESDVISDKLMRLELFMNGELNGK